MVADETKAIDAVVKADKKRTALLEECQKLTAEAEKGNTKMHERLQEVCTISLLSTILCKNQATGVTSYFSTWSFFLKYFQYI